LGEAYPRERSSASARRQLMSNMIGLLAQLALGASWVDAVTSLAVVGLLVKEGREAWTAEKDDD